MVVWMTKIRYKYGRDVRFNFQDGERVAVKGLFGKPKFGYIVSHSCGINGRDGYFANYKIHLDTGEEKDYREDEMGREVIG